MSLTPPTLCDKIYKAYHYQHYSLFTADEIATGDRRPIMIKTQDDGRQVSRTMKNTADAVLFWDRLYDSVNGSHRGAIDSGKMWGPVQDARDGSNKHGGCME